MCGGEFDIPKGYSKIARRFIAGYDVVMFQVPRERLRSLEASAVSSRLEGSSEDPALKRGAIVGRRFATGDRN